MYDASTPMRNILEDLLERLNNDFKSRLKVDYDILPKWYVHMNASESFFEINILIWKVSNHTICS